MPWRVPAAQPQATIRRGRRLQAAMSATSLDEADDKSGMLEPAVHYMICRKNLQIAVSEHIEVPQAIEQKHKDNRAYKMLWERRSLRNWWCLSLS